MRLIMVDPKTLNYKNVTISGLPGAGSSILGQKLSQVLGWEWFSGGDFMRDYAVKKGLFDKTKSVHHSAAVYGDDFDREVDYGMRATLKKESGKILESWLSGFVAQGIKSTLKVLVYCSNDDIRVDRLVNRDKVSIEEAKRHIFDRQEKNLNKWTRIYQKEWQTWVARDKQSHRLGQYFNFYHPTLYDLVINTYSHDRRQTLNLVLKKLNAPKTLIK